MTPRLRFDRTELAGAFGDVGTDLPLLVGLVVTCGLDPASVAIGFGALQIVTGLVYGIPMPVQPLKAMAAIMLAQKLAPGVLAGGGLVIGAVMLLLAVTGALTYLTKLVALPVVRGVQVGLGLSLATLALKDYVAKSGAFGFALAGGSALLLLALRGQKRVPAPLIVMGLGAIVAAVVSGEALLAQPLVGLSAPTLIVPTLEELQAGALLLALPQIPLSLGNSVIATSQATRDLFPERAVSVRKIGLTYGLMNVFAPWFGAVPACHGCGGLVGFWGFGARTGGAAVLYGAMYLVAGLFFAPGFTALAQSFPMPVLGVVLLFEAVLLVSLVRDVAKGPPAGLWIALFVAACVLGLPYGYVVGLLAGTLLHHAHARGWLRLPSDDQA